MKQNEITQLHRGNASSAPSSEFGIDKLSVLTVKEKGSSPKNGKSKNVPTVNILKEVESEDE